MAWKTENERMEYAEKAGNISKKIAEILKMENGHIITDNIKESLKKYQSEADFLKNKLKNNEFEIAIVGLEKAGKSSFSNAIMEKNILPTDDERCTYTATCICYANEDKANVKFYGQEEFDKDFVDKLEKVGIENAADYSYQTIELETYDALYEKRKGGRYDETLNEDIRNIIQNKSELSKYLGMPEKVYKGNELESEEFLGFIKKPGQAIAVKEVNIYSKELNEMRNAVIYDVPGFNSPTEMHKKQTLGKMDNADAIVMVAKGDEPSLTGDVLQIFRQSDKDGNQLKEKLFVFANKSDRATDFIHNREKTYEEWTKRYPYVDSKDKEKRIIFGSANAHLQNCGQLEGDHFIRSVQEKGLPDGDGIERIKSVLEEYNQTQRSEVLKRRIRMLLEEVKKLFSHASGYKDTDMQKGESGARTDLALELYSVAQDMIPKKLEKLNSQIKSDMGSRPLSNNISEKIKALISSEKCAIRDEEIAELHNKYAGVGNSEEISRVEDEIREKRFNLMYHEFSREIVDMAQGKHEEYENAIIEAAIEALGVKKGAATEEKVKEELRKLFEEAEIIKEKGDYYQGLVERFSRDIYEILIKTPYKEERSKGFYDSKDNFYSMSIFYRDQGEEELCINEKIADLPMCRLLLFHTYKKEKENVIAAYEKLKEFVGNNEEIFDLLKCLGTSTPLHVIEIAAEICKEIMGEADEDARISLAGTLLKRQCQMSSDKHSATNFADKEKFQEQYRRFHAERGNRDYIMVKQDFADDVEILCDILQNAFINAIDIEKTFVAKEQKIIEDIRTFVGKKREFREFIVKNLYLIKHQECSYIREREKREQLNQVCMERIRELLTELN